jgi:Adenine-specific methyltransferase EcoRI/HNH endonuclease
VAGNNALGRAGRAKNDEFYTQLVDVEAELRHYRDHLRGKVVFCNCDDPYESNFFKYFAMNFNYLGLKKLITTAYSGSPITGQQLSLLDIAGMPKSIPERPAYRVEITEVPDVNNDGAIDLSDVEFLLKKKWLTHAKSIFSRTGCPAYLLASKYMNGTPIRQDYLETAISWLSGGDIEQYMSAHQHDPNANELWSYFQAVIHWAELTFTRYRKEMKGVEWGGLYDQFKGGLYDTAELEDEIKALMIDDDVTRKKGIYSYVLTRDEKYLAIRAFTPAQRREAYERQDGICPVCGKHYDIDGMEANHITPWSQGGKTNAANCQMLCREDNRRKGAI